MIVVSKAREEASTVHTGSPFRLQTHTTVSQRSPGRENVVGSFLLKISKDAQLLLTPDAVGCPRFRGSTTRFIIQLGQMQETQTVVQFRLEQRCYSQTQDLGAFSHQTPDQHVKLLNSFSLPLESCPDDERSDKWGYFPLQYPKRKESDMKKKKPPKD